MKKTDQSPNITQTTQEKCHSITEDVTPKKKKVKLAQ